MTLSPVHVIAARDLEVRAEAIRSNPRLCHAHLLAARREIDGHLEALERDMAQQSRDAARREAFGEFV